MRYLPSVAAAAAVGDVMPQGDSNVADIIGRDGRPAAAQSLARSADPDTMRLSPDTFGALELESGTWAKGTRQVAIDQLTAAAQHYAPGDRVTIAVGGTRFELTGTVSYLDAG